MFNRRNHVIPCSLVLAAFTAFPSAALANGDGGTGRVIITEIMYNPNSKEDKGQTEWVEIANVGDEAVEISDWRLDDEDKWDWGRFSCTLAPGGVAVLFNADYLTEEQFRAAWEGKAEGEAVEYQAIGVKWGGIANTPGPDNELLQLLDDKGAVICEVKQVGQFPECNRPDGMSIHLIDLTVSELSDGKIWKRSDSGVAGAHANNKTETFGGNDIGSPGFVPGLDSVGTMAASPAQSDKTVRSSGSSAGKSSGKSSAKPKDAKPVTKKPEKSPDKKPAPAATPPTTQPTSQPSSRPDNKIDY